MTRVIVPFALVLGVFQSAPPTPRPATPPLVYDSFCQKEPEEKRRLFKEAAPADRASIMKTHLERWRDANQARLTPDQLALLKDMIAAMVPDTFSDDREVAKQKAATLESLEDRGKAAFSNDDRRALRRDAPCVPKKPA